MSIFLYGLVSFQPNGCHEKLQKLIEKQLTQIFICMSWMAVPVRCPSSQLPTIKSWAGCNIFEIMVAILNVSTISISSLPQKGGRLNETFFPTHKVKTDVSGKNIPFVFVYIFSFCLYFSSSVESISPYNTLKLREFTSF